MEFEQATRSLMSTIETAYYVLPDIMLMNGKGPLDNPMSIDFESFNVTQGTFS
jgi:hypothetical protein